MTSEPRSSFRSPTRRAASASARRSSFSGKILNRFAGIFPAETKGQRGATLVELIIASVIFIVLAMAAAGLYTTTAKVFVKNKLTEDLQREGDAVLAHISRNLKEAVQYDAANSNLSINPNSIQVRLSNNQARRYYVTANQLHYLDESGADSNLLAPNTTVSSLTFTQDTSGGTLRSVTVRATLTRTRSGQTVSLDIGSTISTRPQ